MAEDNAVNRRVVSRMLERMGHHVTLVENGAELLETLAHAPFDVALVDVHMPVMDGLTAARHITAGLDGAPRRPHLVALTASAFAEDRAAAQSAGFDDFVSKPIGLDALEAALAGCGVAA